MIPSGNDCYTAIVPLSKWTNPTQTSSTMGFNPFTNGDEPPSIEMNTDPLVICYIAIERGHRNSAFSHKKCDFP